MAKRLNALGATWVILLVLGGIIRAQQPTVSWQQDVRHCVELRDWTGALTIVHREILRAPQDIDVRAWRARVLAWSGQLTEAEKEYREILAVAPDDPDNWLGLASVYSRQGLTNEAVPALSRAVDLDPNRADVRVARARALHAAGRQVEAKLEFKKALALDPTNAEARGGLLSLRAQPKHELRFGLNTDLLSFADANHDEGVTLSSAWTPHWRTTVGGNFYQRAGTDAGKFVAGLTGNLPIWGALTVGGARGATTASFRKQKLFLITTMDGSYP